VPESAETRVSALAGIYRITVLRYPRAIVSVFLASLLFFGYHLIDFRMDASSDSLVLENDADLRFYEQTRELFGSDDYIILAITPEEPVFSEGVLEKIRRLSDDLNALSRVESVASILTVPLFRSPPVSLFEMGSGHKTLLMEDCDRRLAATELTESPLWRNNLISADGRTTAVVITFRPEPEYNRLRDERYRLRRMEAAGILTDPDKEGLERIGREYSAKHAALSAQRRIDVRQIRFILGKYRSPAFDIAESGLPMIVADMVTYIERDIIVFGIAVVLFLALVLSLVFREMRWTVLPLLTCSIPVVVMMGYLGLTGWETTVVTANFSSLLLIISMQNCIYLIVRFREIHARQPEMEREAILFRAVREVSTPCFFASATAMVGFAALMISGIRPVIDFGILMSTGLGMAYCINFIFFPAAIQLFPKGSPPPRRLAKLEHSPVSFLADLSRRRSGFVIGGSCALLALGIFGISKLEVENRFIDYFREHTPISRGLRIIDERMGGTTSLEIVLQGGKTDYWLEPEKLALLRRIHRFVEGMPNVGKVNSLDSLIAILTEVNNGIAPNRFILNLARASLSGPMKQAYLHPYVTEDFSTARVFVRIRESSPTLRRDAMLEELRTFLHRELSLSDEQFRVTGLFVLYNNLLKSLFDSQIKTVGMVFAAIYCMLILLFRSFYLALVVVLPALLPIFVILGTMGLMRISLDMMTIMIASVTMGIAVDNMIQYTFRYRSEYRAGHGYHDAAKRSHNSIGLAILYSNLTIITGFGILALSNFIPTVYFGLFTGMAMAAGFSASLTLLPVLLAALRPLRRK